MRTIKKKAQTFPRGVHPPHKKELTENSPIKMIPPPERVYIPMSQHIGAPASVLVQKGDSVKRGQLIGEASGFISSPVHSSVSGVVLSVLSHPHPNGKIVTTVEIENDGLNSNQLLQPYTDWHEIPSAHLLSRIAEAGIVGMGGAGFPTHVKLSPPSEHSVDTLVINAAECEPFLNPDKRLMIEETEEILTGISIARRVLDVKSVYIGVETNTPQAIKNLNIQIKRTGDFNSFNVVSLVPKYPQGSEKQLIQAVLKRVVPSGKLPSSVGAVVINIGTAKAIYDAVVKGVPLIERVITISGDSVNSPANLRVPLGTPVRDLLTLCQTDLDEPNLILNGGPMMGTTISNTLSPVIKTTSAITCLISTPPAVKSHPCINCGACQRACPTGLLPAIIVKAVEKRALDKLQELSTTDCIECGSCSYICPSKISLVSAIRLGKNRLISLKKS